MREWPVGWGGGCGEVFQEGREAFPRRAWSVVSKTDDRASQTALFAPGLAGREAEKENERGRLHMTLTREMSAGGGDRSQAGKS